MKTFIALLLGLLASTGLGQSIKRNTLTTNEGPAFTVTGPFTNDSSVGFHGNFNVQSNLDMNGVTWAYRTTNVIAVPDSGTVAARGPYEYDSATGVHTNWFTPGYTLDFVTASNRWIVFNSLNSPLYGSTTTDVQSPYITLNGASPAPNVRIGFKTLGKHIIYDGHMIISGQLVAINPANILNGVHYGNGGGLTNLNIFATNAYIASRYGCTLNGNAAGGGTTNFDTHILQSLLDKATNGRPIAVVIDGIAVLTNSLTIRSNTLLIGIGPGAGVVAVTNMNHTPIKTILGTNITSQNIVISDLTVYGNSGGGQGIPLKPNQFPINITNQTGQNFEYYQPLGVVGSTSNAFACGIWISGSSNVELRNVTIEDALGYSLLITHSKNIKAINMTYRHGEDAIHCVGGLVNSIFSGATFDQTHDNCFNLLSREVIFDTFAYNAGNEVYTNIVAEGFSFINGTPTWTKDLGQIGVSFGDTTTDNFFDQIILKNWHGTVSQCFINAFSLVGGSISFSDFDIKVESSSNGFFINLSPVMGTLSVTGCRLIFTSDPSAALFMSGATNVIISSSIFDLPAGASSSVLSWLAPDGNSAAVINGVIARNTPTIVSDQGGSTAADVRISNTLLYGGGTMTDGSFANTSGDAITTSTAILVAGPGGFATNTVKLMIEP